MSKIFSFLQNGVVRRLCVPKYLIFSAFIALLALLINLSNMQVDFVSLILKPHDPGKLKRKAKSRSLNPLEKQIAETAWVYFKNNYQEASGLVNSVDGYPSTTLWDTASYLGGLISARELGIIEKEEFDKRFNKFIETFRNLKLFRNIMPNKAYHTVTKEIVGYNNKPGEIGFSALDIGRLLIWFKISKMLYPEYATDIDQIVEQWDFSHVIDQYGDMYGAILNKKKEIEFVQEGRFGYEEYAAKGFQLWGFNTKKALKENNIMYLVIYDVPIPYDIRDPRVSKAHNYVTSESYLLEGIELGWHYILNGQLDQLDTWKVSIAANIFEVQKRRYLDTGIITARSEHQLDKAPYFVYDSIYSDGYPWNVITDTGEYYPNLSAFATKVGVGFWAFFDDSYSEVLLQKALTLIDPKKGFYEGWYENGQGPIHSYTCNTNGIILETLYFKTKGSFLKQKFLEPTNWEITIKKMKNLDMDDNKKGWPGYAKQS